MQLMKSSFNKGEAMDEIIEEVDEIENEVTRLDPYLGDERILGVFNG